MMHHYMGFFALDCFFLALNALGLGAADFSVRAFRTVANYMYAPSGRSEWNALYLLCGLALPLGITQCLGWAKAALGRAVFRRSTP